MHPTTFSLTPYIEAYLASGHYVYCHDEAQIFFSDSSIAVTFIQHLENLFQTFSTENEKSVQKRARNLARYATTGEIPYLIVHHILENFKKILLEALLADDRENTLIIKLLRLHNMAERSVAQLYLARQVPKFVRHNFLRIRSIHELIDKSILDFFESHLNWLNNFSDAILALDPSKLPQLQPHACDLGRWLIGEGREFIGDDERYQTLTTVHRNLHLVAKRTEMVLKEETVDFHYLMMLLKNADLLSHAIGLELAFIHNIEFVRASSKDPLTGALNRRLFYNIFHDQFDIAKALERSFGVIMTDIDDFKQINDRYGHVTGDKVLQSFAALLCKEVRKSDLVIRYGGEEFIILLPVATHDETVQIAEKLRRKVAETVIDTAEGPITITSSFGVEAVTPLEQETPSQALLETVIERVDTKLYLAKSSGKTGSCEQGRQKNV